MEMKITDLNLKEYDYDLPTDRIAQYPAVERDLSRLLLFKDNNISMDIFRNIHHYLPKDSLLVFNNTRVIQARIITRKETGAIIEILCLEPLSPVEYELSFGSREPVEWKCIIGNLKKWKSGTIKIPYLYRGIQNELTATKVGQEGDSWRIRFEWGSTRISFGEVIELTGQLPLPPYIERDPEPDDLDRYQTVYSRFNGSVAAPTAGLHFTDRTIESIKETGTSTAEITLHVGAGTFKPIKSQNIADHEMHCEHFYITRETIEKLINHLGRIIAVGTTSARTLESLYWLGINLRNNPKRINSEVTLGQWEVYETDAGISEKDSLEYILKLMDEKNLKVLSASTKLLIIPGYKFRIINSLITNFHQPGSSLLLLVSAFAGEKWKEIYSYALDNNFRFLSYGDCSFIQRPLNHL